MFRVHELINATCGNLAQGDAFLEVKGVSIDTRTIRKNDAFIAIKGDNFDGHDFIAEAVNKGAGCIILQKGRARVPRRNVAVIEVGDSVQALGSIAKFHRQRFDIPVIAITGSSGKTTVKEMSAWVLARAHRVLKNQGTQNNHIGVPLTLLNLTCRHTVAVVELGTNHCGEIEHLAKICCPTIGVVTNIGPAHLEFFGTLAGVAREKYALIEQLIHPFIAIVNNDDAFLKKKTGAGAYKPFTIGFGIRSPGDFTASCVTAAKGNVAFEVNKKYGFTLNTAGCHNIYNALAAIAIARVLGLGYPECARRLRSFDFPKGRGNLVLVGEAQFIDDTYNSNPLSLRQALETLASLTNKGRKICVLGDMLELGSRKESFHRRAGKLAAKVCDTLIAVGQLSKISAEEAYSSGLSRRDIFTCNSSCEAADILQQKVAPRKGDLVLVKGSRGMKMEEIFKKISTRNLKLKT